MIDPPTLSPADRARIAVQAPLDRQLAPLGRRAIDALALRPGEHVLDIGCGAGQTLLDLGRAVGAGGRALGVDISRAMLDVARANTVGIPAIDLLQADAQTHAFPAAEFDAAYSRFGVMFFADPAAAFANIRRALKPGGRLAFVCWRAEAENELDMVPLTAAAPHLPPRPADDGPNPFAFADPNHLRKVLTEAGFQSIELAPHDRPVVAGDLETTLALVLAVGSLGKILRENPHLRPACEAPVREALAQHLTPEGVALTAATWIASARAP